MITVTCVVLCIIVGTLVIAVYLVCDWDEHDDKEGCMIHKSSRIYKSLCIVGSHVAGMLYV